VSTSASIPDLGERSDGNLVLIHGWGMNAAVWNGFPAQIAPGLRPYPIELPGHGRCRFDPGQNDLRTWADACLAAAPERAVWLGWSLGGLVALAAARRAPERIGALILMTATPRFVRAADWMPAMPEETLAQFHDGLTSDPSGTLSRFLTLELRGSEDARETLRELRRRLASRPEPDPAALSVGLDLLRNEDLRGPLPDVRCPALWLFGGRDTLVPVAVAGRIEILMPGARTVVIPGAAHAPFLSHRAETRAALRGFLEEPRA